MMCPHIGTPQAYTCVWNRHTKCVRGSARCPIFTESKYSHKHDKGKARWDLLPMDIIDEAVDILTTGVEIYGENSWRDVPNGAERYYAAMMRHIRAYRKGVLVDTDSGKAHLAHALCNLLFQYELIKEREHGRSE